MMILKKNIKYLFSLLLIGVVLIIVSIFTFSTRVEDDQYKQDFESKYQVFSIGIPEYLNFAGEKMPLNDFEVYERMDRELLINTYWQTQTLLTHKRSNRWFPLIEPILKQNGVPADFKYIPVIETGFMNLTSPAGAVGFWQFMEGTAKELGLEINSQVDERYHVEKSTRAACKYFNRLYKELGSWTLVAAAYNMGLSGLKSQMKKQKATNYYDLLLNDETSRYVFRLLAIKEVFEHPEQYGYRIRKKDMYSTIPTYLVKVDTPVIDFVDFAQKMNVSYKTLKVFNPWLRDTCLANPGNKMYYIQLPKGEYKSSSSYN